LLLQEQIHFENTFQRASTVIEWLRRDLREAFYERVGKVITQEFFGSFRRAAAGRRGAIAAENAQT